MGWLISEGHISGGTISWGVISGGTISWGLISGVAYKRGAYKWGDYKLGAYKWGELIIGGGLKSTGGLIRAILRYYTHTYLVCPAPVHCLRWPPSPHLTVASQETHPLLSMPLPARRLEKGP